MCQEAILQNLQDSIQCKIFVGVFSAKLCLGDVISARGFFFPSCCQLCPCVSTCEPWYFKRQAQSLGCSLCAGSLILKIHLFVFRQTENLLFCFFIYPLSDGWALDQLFICSVSLSLNRFKHFYFSFYWFKATWGFQQISKFHCKSQRFTIVISG